MEQYNPEYKEELPLNTDNTNNYDNRGFSVLSNTKDIRVRKGSQSYRVNNDGMFLGSEQFGTAPFSVDMNGNMKASSGTFGGNLSGGTITGVNISGGTIIGSNIYSNNFRYNRWTTVHSLSSLDGWETSATAGGTGTISVYSSNICLLSTPTGLDETTAMQVGSYGIELGTSNANPITYAKSPIIEWVAKVALQGDGVAWLRLGDALSVEAVNIAKVGFDFLLSGGNHIVKANYSDGVSSYSSNALQISGTNVNSSLWHKYKLVVSANGANWNLNFYIDDTSVYSWINVAIGGFPGKNFGAKVKNNYMVVGAPHSAVLTIGSSIFQQDY